MSTLRTALNNGASMLTRKFCRLWKLIFGCCRSRRTFEAMLRLWLLGARRLGARERLIIALLIGSILFLLSLHHRVDPTPSAIKSPLASFRLRGSANKATIPRILHQTWKNKQPPEVVRPWVESWLKENPTWEYWFWTDDDMRSFIEVKYPQFLKLYDSYPKQAFRNDAFRYFVLFEYGGIYADMDMQCLRSLDPILDLHPCIVSQEPLEHAHFLSTMGPPLVSNALMACRPGHPFFQRVIKDLASYAGFLYWKTVVHATGPNMLTEVFRGYHQGWFGFGLPSEPVYLALPEEFQPMPDASMVESMREMCMYSDGKDLLSDKFMARQQALCKRLASFDFKPRPSPESYTVHHWTHTWAGKANDPYGVHGESSRTFDVDSLKFVQR